MEVAVLRDYMRFVRTECNLIEKNLAIVGGEAALAKRHPFLKFPAL